MSWPFAYPPTGATGRVRVELDDFLVEEVVRDPPCGSGEHLWLRVEKRGLDTEAVAGALARAFDVPRSEVSYAGLKDRRAVSRQWFSVRPGGTASDAECASTIPLLPGARVLECARHARKLRRGEHEANRFRVRVRAWRGDVDRLSERVHCIAALGAPNYFGPQRFGRDGGNLGLVRDWVRTRRLPPRGFQRGIVLSSARAHLFNAVLGARIAAVGPGADAYAWRAVLEGDVLDAASAPTGPLWGRGRSPAGSIAAAMERRALEGYEDWLHALEHAGLRQERRSFVCLPRNLVAEREGDSVCLAFELDPGCYATAVLRELGSFQEPSRVENPPVAEADDRLSGRALA